MAAKSTDRGMRAFWGIEMYFESSILCLLLRLPLYDFEVKNKL